MNDSLDIGAWRRAHTLDAEEPEIDKAWREVLRGHAYIQYQIEICRRALHDMGVTMTRRGRRYIEAVHKKGWCWSDPKPNVTLTNAQKQLLRCLADMPRRWNILHKMEDSQKPFNPATANTEWEKIEP